MTAQFDMPLDELRVYDPVVAEPDDFDRFWSEHLAEARAIAMDVRMEPVTGLVSSVRVFDCHFPGHGGAPIAAWLYVPRDMAPETPVVVQFIGYNGGRGSVLDWLGWSSVGYAHLVVDSRGQGGGWRPGDTPDPGATGEPGVRSFLTSGLRHPETHYYKRLYVDAVRALDAVAAIDLVDGPVVTAGGSQGGALAIAAAHLSGDAAVCLPEVPFLAHFRRAVSITDQPPYSEIARYCSTYPDRIEDVFHTLSYFDVVNHAKRVSSPALFSVGLLDEVTPPSTVFAVFNAYAGDKKIEVYEFNGHEGGGSLHFERQVSYLEGQLG